MARVDNQLQLHVLFEPQKTVGSLRVTVPSGVIDELYGHALSQQQSAGPMVGFNKNDAPLRYLDVYYHENLVRHLKEFLLKYVVVSFVYQQLTAQRSIIIGEPRLVDIEFELHKDAHYIFAVTRAQPVLMRDWKRLPFKAPLRKRYQDIDRQATTFLVQEREREESYAADVVSLGDWVLFEAMIADKNGKPLIKNFSEKLWFHVSGEATSEPFSCLFLGKKNGETFLSDGQCLADYFGCQISNPYSYLIKIHAIVPAAYFCVDSFKNHFRLRSEKNAHKKMVEVYSFRNDISLRRATVEEAFMLLLRTYPLEIPESTILRQEKIIVERLQQNPDYSVYKLQQDFDHKIRMLAEKQVREQLLTRMIAAQEEINLHDEEVNSYINLVQRSRTKEFVHFAHPALRAVDEDWPIPHAELKYHCLHEKTLNYILHHLTKGCSED